MSATTAGESDEEDGLRAVRRFQAQEILRIGLHDVAGSLDVHEVTAQLSLVAETCLAAAIEIVMPALVKRLGAPRTGLTVLALGSLGAREMRYGSDLDLVASTARAARARRASPTRSGSRALRSA